MTRVGTVLPEVLGGMLPESVTARRANWIEVARTDVADARRSRVLWALCWLFSTLVLFAAMISIYIATADFEPFSLALTNIDFVVRFTVPLAALVVGGLAVVGEREAGSLRVLLGLPITRRDVVAGKFLGRVVVFSAVLSIGFALAGVGMWYFHAGFDPGTYALFVVQKLLLGTIFVGVGVGFSAMLRSRAQAVGASAGVFALVGLVWHAFPAGAFYLVDGRYPENVPPPWEPPAWFVFLGNANPLNGLEAIFQTFLYSGRGRAGTLEYRNYLVESAEPFYLQPEFLLAVMALWALVPLLIGNWRFGRSDLG